MKLAEGRRSQSAQRVNQALPHPAAVATTVASAQALWDARAFHIPRPASLEKLFARLFAEAGHLPALTQLPPEAPVRAATFDHDTSTLRTFLTPGSATRSGRSGPTRQWPRSAAARRRITGMPFWARSTASRCDRVQSCSIVAAGRASAVH